MFLLVVQFVLFPCRSIPRRVPVQAPSIPDPPVWTLRSLRAHTAASTLRTGRDVSNVDCVLFLFGFLCVSNWLSYPTDDCYEVVRPKCLGLHSHDHQPHALRNMMTAPTYGNGCHVSFSAFVFGILYSLLLSVLAFWVSFCLFLCRGYLLDVPPKYSIVPDLHGKNTWPACRRVVRHVYPTPLIGRATRTHRRLSLLFCFFLDWYLPRGSPTASFVHRSVLALGDIC